jgi:PAS domain-containing protein
MLAAEPLWQVYAEHREEYFAVPGTRSLGLDLELIGRHQDGTEFPINVTMSLIDTGDVLLAITRVGEVTRRKQAVAKAELLDAIVEYSHDAITGLTLEGIITSWNPAAVRMYGYSNTEVIARPELFQPPDASELALSTHRRSPPNPASTDRQARPLAPRRPAHVTTPRRGIGQRTSEPSPSKPPAHTVSAKSQLRPCRAAPGVELVGCAQETEPRQQLTRLPRSQRTPGIDLIRNKPGLPAASLAPGGFWSPPHTLFATSFDDNQLQPATTSQ